MASSGAPMLSWICSGVRVSPMLLRYSWRFTVKQRHADYAASASSQTRPHNLQLGYPPCLCESHPLLVWSFKKLIVLPTEQDQQEVPGGQGRSSQASDVASCPLLRRAPPVGSNIARCFNPKKDAHFMNLYHALWAKLLDTYDFAAGVSQCSEDVPWHWVSQRPQSPHHQMLNRPVHLPAHHLWHGASESEGVSSPGLQDFKCSKIEVSHNENTRDWCMIKRRQNKNSKKLDISNPLIHRNQAGCVRCANFRNSHVILWPDVTVTTVFLWHSFTKAVTLWP